MRPVLRACGVFIFGMLLSGCCFHFLFLKRINVQHFVCLSRTYLVHPVWRGWLGWACSHSFVSLYLLNNQRAGVSSVFQSKCCASGDLAHCCDAAVIVTSCVLPKNRQFSWTCPLAHESRPGFCAAPGGSGEHKKSSTYTVNTRRCF